jgi:acetyl-CoA acetyltransferase
MRDSVVVLGTGLHPWGNWGRPVLEYASVAARVAIADAGISWGEIGFVSAAGSVRCGYPGYVAASSISRMLGLHDVEAVTTYGACVSGAQALAVGRDRILAGGCDVALVVGADVAKPVGQEIAEGNGAGHATMNAAPNIPNRAWLGLLATRRMHESGTTTEDLHRVRIKNSAHGASNMNARFKMPLSMRDIELSPLVASPLRLLHVSTFSDGAAAVVIASEKFARKTRGAHVRIRAISVSVLSDDGIEMPYVSARMPRFGTKSGRASNVSRTLHASGVAPEDLSAVELYDVSSVSELDWYEHIGLCRIGEAEELLKSGSTTLGGRIPVNVSGGLTSFGEAVSAQALAQICELTGQLQGRCGERQIARARTGLAVCDGMYGHVASAVLST